MNAKVKSLSIPNSINKFLIILFIFISVFLPADNFNIKILSLLLLLIFNIKKCFFGYNASENIISFFGFILTSLTIIWSIILTKDLSNIKLGYMGYILLLYPIVKNEKVNFYNILIKTLDFLAIFIVLMWLFDISKILPMYDNLLLMWFNNSGNAMIGKGSHVVIGVQYFFKTTPLLFLSLMERLKHKRYVLSIIISIAIILSGTRANILCLFFATVFYYTFLFPKRRIRSFAILICVLFLIYVILDGTVVSYVISMFEKKVSSDQVRSGHLKGILEVFKGEPAKLFFGSGFSSVFYSYGINSLTQNIELSYWNLLRQVGLFLFIPMMFMFLYPVFKLIRKKTNYALVLGYVLYLIIAYTNPLLYSSTGMLYVLFMYYKSFQTNKLIVKDNAKIIS